MQNSYLLQKTEFRVQVPRLAPGGAKVAEHATVEVEIGHAEVEILLDYH